MSDFDIARATVHKTVDLHCERALIEIHLLANLARQCLKRKFEHANRSAGQRRRWAKAVDKEVRGV